MRAAVVVFYFKLKFLRLVSDMSVRRHVRVVEECSFPVGTDRPARRRPWPVPFCRAGWPNVKLRARSETQFCVSGEHVPYIRDMVSLLPSLLSRTGVTTMIRVSEAQARTRCSESTIPRYRDPGYHQEQLRLRLLAAVIRTSRD